MSGNIIKLSTLMQFHRWLIYAVFFQMETTDVFEVWSFKTRKKKTLQIYSWMKELSRTCCYVESSSKKKLQIVHIRKLGTYRDCWAQLYDGIPPKKICEHEPKLNSSREHILWVRQEARSQLGKAQAPKMASAKHRDCVAQLFL